MKRKFYITLISSFFALSAFSQITLKEKTTVKSDSTQGFFVKGGTLKLDKLECYHFGDMIVAFNMDKSYFEYDEVSIWLAWGLGDEVDYRDAIVFKKAEFARLFSDKDKYIYFYIFTTADLKEVSKKFPDCKRNYMQYTGIKSLVNGSKLYASVEGRNVTGKEITYETRSDGKLIEKEIDVWTEYDILNSFNIPMLNRIKLSGSASMFGKYPEEPQVTGDCYK